MILWVPLVSGALELGWDGPRDFWRSWAIAIAIGDVACLLSFIGALIAREVLAAITRWRGKPFRERSASFYFGVVALLLPCVLPCGLACGVRVAKMLGRSYHPNLGSYRIALAFGAITVALLFLQRARSDARDRIRDLERANLEAQLAALTAEMNPHMLFNALNTIASLVHHDPDRAEQTVLELAEVYRGILRSSGAKTHPLADELRLCEAYLRVERARFGDRLSVVVDVEDGALAREPHVPVLIVQPLVENAIKHGVAARASGGTVAVRVRGDGDAIDVVVEDDGIGFGKSETRGNGRALANCEERLRLAYGKAASLHVAARDTGGTRAHLRLPNAA
jgi:two-component sensor histidine kinase